MYLCRLKELREDHDITQQEIADFLGISQRYYSNLENGTRNISVELLIKISDFYNISLDYICEKVE